MEVPTAGLPYGALSLAQFETERLLEEGLHRRGGAVAYGWSLPGLVEQADGVVAQIQSLEGHIQEVRCRWLVGCDGAHSKVRPQSTQPALSICQRFPSKCLNNRQMAVRF
jgi:2-polyprenyl-6-methoxyphenol hydroxylase-like FAD-dependent oxidoreductase